MSRLYCFKRNIYWRLNVKIPLEAYLAIGISSMIGIQSFINLGGISGVIPIDRGTIYHLLAMVDHRYYNYRIAHGDFS